MLMDGAAEGQRRPGLGDSADLVMSAICFIISGTCAVRAADHFLTIGGGNSVSNNQVSLVKNVIYLQRFLSSAGLESAPHEILFSDGNGTERDVEFVGASVIAGPDGWAVAGPASQTAEELLIADVDLAQIATLRQRSPRNQMNDDRVPDVYERVHTVAGVTPH